MPLLLSRYTGGLLLAGANLLYLIGSMWLIVVWKTHVFHPRFLLSGVVILFTVATLLAFAFLVGVVTSSTGVSLMTTYAVFFLAALLVAARAHRGGGLDRDRGEHRARASTGSCPRRPSSGRRPWPWSPGQRRPSGWRTSHHFAVYGSTAVFGAAALTLSAWLFSRKDF